jgi:SAM-dependent methyltransferase
MEPHCTGHSYDRIATEFHRSRGSSSSGIAYLERALRHARRRGWALDAGCGTGVPITRHLLEAGYRVTAIDVSEGMLSIAAEAVPEAGLCLSDMATFDEGQRYDLVVAWDSYFHLPYGRLAEALAHLCGLVAPSGVLLLTTGGVDGEIQGDNFGQSFYYSSLSVGGYFSVLQSAGMKCILMERDQYPEEHVVFIAQKVQPEGRQRPPLSFSMIAPKPCCHAVIPAKAGIQDCNWRTLSAGNCSDHVSVSQRRPILRTGVTDVPAVCE